MLRYSVSSNLNKIRGRFSSTLPYYTNPYKGNGCLGLVREDFSMWERRSPLCPHHVQELVRQGLKVIVQPSTKRIYTDKEYMDAGAIIKEDLSDASLVIGVKQIPASKIADNKSYLFFSHTIKAQANNMQLLDTILEKKARLFDYECITEGGLDGKPRLVAFGKYAGVAGMIDCFQGLGQKLLAEGYSNPFLNIPQSYMYQNLDEARYTLRSIGAHIERYGLPEEISPMVFTFTGGGNVTKGAREMFELLPFEYVDVRELPSLAADVKSGKRKNNRLYAVLTSAKDMVKHKDGSPLVNNRDYYDNPKDYVPVFHENVIPYTSVLVNGMYWDARYPRLLTNSQIQDIRKGGNKNLKMVADITCDPQGSVEFLSHCTTIEKPFFSYIPEADENSDNLEADGIAMLGVEILPSEVPRDASEHFGEALMPLLPPLLRSAGSVTCDDMSDLPKEMQRACIASHGKLLPKWEYIQTLREQNHVLQTRSGSSSGTIVLTGHLFDTGVINKVFDFLLEYKKVTYALSNLNVKPNTTGGAVPTTIEIGVVGDASDIDIVTKAIADMVAANEKCNGFVDLKNSTSTSVSKKVLLLGSGMVAMPVLRHLCSIEGVHLTIASDQEAQALDMINQIDGHAEKLQYMPFNYPQDLEKINRKIGDVDLVISLLPATMHTTFAEMAIKHRRHMVTASYVSDAMQALDQPAKDAGVIIMNEVGLDPGIDHMLIKRAIDSIHKQGGTVKELISLCGGLPDPASADNPLRYKFSWSPKGVLTAASNGAVRLLNGEVITVPQGTLLEHAEPSSRFPTMRLEALPNRDSVKYRELYGVPDVDTLCRGTLRFEGWSNVMHGLQCLGLFEQEAVDGSTWKQLLQSRLDTGADGAQLEAILRSFLASRHVKGIDDAVVAIKWLGLLTDAQRSSTVPIDSLCSLLQEKLKFEEGEKDMVAMYHTVLGSLPDGTFERHTSRLLAFGNPNGDSAMAATVGYTTAAAAELILQGKVNETGVLIPTTESIYNPMLAKLQELGVTFTEAVEKIE